MTASRFQILKRINSGGMAEIFLGASQGPDGSQRICAIKRVIDDLDNEDYARMFADEIKMSQLLHHSNIVQTYGSDVVDGATCLIMEFVQGIDLEYLLHNCRKTQVYLSVPMAVYVAIEVSAGLEYAHNLKDPLTEEPLNIVHRDISPSNVIVSFEGEVKITDFGIAKSKLSSSKTQTGIVKGKYSYMSPEYLSGSGFDHRSDIYSLGVVLWELLAGDKLHSGDRNKNLLETLLEKKNRRRLTMLNPDVDQPLEDIVERCLSQKPTERYQSMGELHKDLLGYLGARDAKFHRGKLGSFLKTMLAKDFNRVRKLIKESLLELKAVAEQTTVLPVAAGGEFAGQMPSRDHPVAQNQGNDQPRSAVAQEQFVPGLVNADQYLAKGRELVLNDNDRKNVVNLAQKRPQQPMMRGGNQPMSRAPVKVRTANRAPHERYHKEPSQLGVNLVLLALLVALLVGAVLLYRSKNFRVGALRDAVTETDRD